MGLELVLPGLGQSRVQGSSHSWSQTSSCHQGEQSPFPKHPTPPCKGGEGGRGAGEGRCWQQSLGSAADGPEIPAGSGEGTVQHSPSRPCWVPCGDQARGQPPAPCHQALPEPGFVRLCQSRDQEQS